MSHHPLPTTPAPILLLQIDRLPCPQKISFETYIQTADEPSQMNIRQLTFHRNEFIDSLHLRDIQKTIETCERYASFLLGFVESVRNSPAPVRTIGPLNFVWTSAFERDELKEYMAYTYRFEVVMTLLTLAFSYINLAFELFREEPTKKYKETIANLKTAAMIFDHVSANELPLWIEPPKERPPEIDANFITKFGIHCLCMAQSISIRNGIANGTITSIALSKLSLFISKSCDELTSSTETNPNYAKHGSFVYWNFFSVQSIIYFVFAQMLAAQDDYSEGLGWYGHACARMAQCIKVFARINDHRQLGHLSFHEEQISTFYDFCIELDAKYTKENDNIYSEIVPDMPLDLPAPMQFVKLDPENGKWTPPRPAFTKLAIH